MFDCKVAAAAVVAADKMMVELLAEDRRKVPQNLERGYNLVHQEELHGAEGHLVGLSCKTAADTYLRTVILILKCYFFQY